MADVLMLAMIVAIGFASGFLTCCVTFEAPHKKSRNEDDSETIGIGTLYIYEGSDRDRYSFAFDCPLDQIGQLKKVTLDIKKRHERSLDKIENDLFAEDFDTNIDNV